MIGILDENNVTSAVFFLDPAIAGNSSVVESARLLGYDVRGWSEKDTFDSRYPPTEFKGLTLSDRSVLGRTDKMADLAAFYSLALHSTNSSVVAFTPAVPPRINHSQSAELLEEILSDAGRTLVYTSEPAEQPASVPMSEPIANATGAAGAVGANTTSSIVLDAGSWNMTRLHTRYPADVAVVPGHDGPAYLVDTSIIVGEDAQVNIEDSIVRLVSPEDDTDRRIEVQGNLTISNSGVSSWDSARNLPDDNPYHQRPFIFVENGRLTIDNSTISHLGFLLSGLGDDGRARAAIVIHESDGFSVTNSTLSYNLDALYARNSSDSTIAGNEIFANTRTGIDVRSGSSGLNIVGNSVHDNGYEGIVCVECTKSFVFRNLVEHNKEAGIKMISTNLTGIRENEVTFNEKFGIFLRDNSTQNALQANVITDSREGLRLAGNSSNNFLFENSLVRNDEAIDIDPSSQPNQQRNNRVES
jgi:parallel beta-helix repeat protein